MVCFFIKCESNKLGLIEIKCPKSKQLMSPEELLKDENFYMCSLNGFPEFFDPSYFEELVTKLNNFYKNMCYLCLLINKKAIIYTE